MIDTVIVDAARTPVGKKMGKLAGAHPTDTLGHVMMKLLERQGLDSGKVDQVVGGCINKVAAQGMNVTRTAWLAHGGSESTPCITIEAGRNIHGDDIGTLVGAGMTHPHG